MIDNGFDSGRQSAEAIFDQARVKANAEANERWSELTASTDRARADALDVWIRSVGTALTAAQKRELKAILAGPARSVPTTG